MERIFLYIVKLFYKISFKNYLYLYEKSAVTFEYIEKVITILEKNTNKLNKLKQAQYFIEHQKFINV